MHTPAPGGPGGGGKGEAGVPGGGVEGEMAGGAIGEAIGRKPKGHDFIIDRRAAKPAVGRHMSVTGG